MKNLKSKLLNKKLLVIYLFSGVSLGFLGKCVLVKNNIVFLYTVRYKCKIYLKISLLNIIFYKIIDNVLFKKIISSNLLNVNKLK